MNANRVNATPNEQLILFGEVNGICPLCPKKLMFTKKQQNHRGFEIAHIYPLNPKPEELIALKGVEKLSDDPNDIKNLICLCVECHTKFDKPRTLDEYNNLLIIKNELIHNHNQKDLWVNTKIEVEIEDILDFLANEDIDFESEDILSYNSKRIDDKINDTITLLTKRKIHRNVQDYFSLIQRKFKEIDKLQPLTSETISQQVKTYYLMLRKQNSKISQREVFDSMVFWLNKITNHNQKEPAEIIISYFIQNCEIFE
ncbi:ABC-three component system protein [Pedobacter sp. WC2501]|uniref:ABC-three component system protein n=1 Tax=Pedobacter sp. WC2501 TaxID=3461400 RepID=UPI004045A774